MDKVTGKLTVFFEDPFWVGIFERSEGSKLSVAKATFGAEPRDYDVYEFILEHYYDLQFSSAVKVSVREESKNPKRKQKNARKAMQEKGIGTKSQQVLKQQHEQNKKDHKVNNREEKAAKEQRQFELKQQKKKEKRRGALMSPLPA